MTTTTDSTPAATLTSTVDAYAETWNETDPAKRAELIVGCLAAA